VDVFGFDAGGNLLKAVAQRIKESLRPTDTLAKLPEDTFILVLSGLRQPDDAQVVVKKVLNAFFQPFRVGEQDVHLTVSIGFALFPTDGKDSETLLKNAELAMFRAKELGGNTAQRFSSDLGMHMANFLILENKLRAAMKGKELALFYQPQVALQEQKIVGMEALIRWLPTQGGIISPGEFIPVAEQSGLIIDIGEWVLKESLANLRSIKKEAGLNHLYVSINLSPRQFMDANLVRLVEEALTHTSLDPHELEIEITESTAMKTWSTRSRSFNRSNQWACGSPWTISAWTTPRSATSTVFPSIRSRLTGPSSSKCSITHRLPLSSRQLFKLPRR